MCDLKIACLLYLLVKEKAQMKNHCVPNLQQLLVVLIWKKRVYLHRVGLLLGTVRQNFFVKGFVVRVQQQNSSMEAYAAFRNLYTTSSSDISIAM